METIELAPMGEIKIIMPRSSVLYDLISTWSSSPSRAHMGRLAAATIGICTNGQRLPRYDTDQANPIAYGGLVFDSLIGSGCRPNDIVEQGMILLSNLAPKLLNEEGLKKK